MYNCRRTLTSIVKRNGPSGAEGSSNLAMRRGWQKRTQRVTDKHPNLCDGRSSRRYTNVIQLNKLYSNEKIQRPFYRTPKCNF